MDSQKTPYFHGSYKDVLISVFNHPRLALTQQGFQDYRRATFERKYSWVTPELEIWNVREGIRSNRPDIIVHYENLAQLKEDEIERLKRDIYGITSGHFGVWGLGAAMNQESAPYFQGSHMNALIAVFPDLNLNALGFELDWSSEEKGIESVKYVLSKEISHSMQQYERIAKLSERDINDLRKKIYGIKQGHFNIWGLGRAMKLEAAPYFQGSYIHALMTVLPDLNLNPLGFQLDWSSEEKGIESVIYVLSREIPHILQQYEKLDQLSERYIHDLRNKIYKITSGHFNVWELGAAMNQRSTPYFQGSHINALLAVFPHTKLGLTREGFAERTGNGTSYANQEIEQMDNSDPASPLMTEDTRNEAVKREMNPNGWITQLFFAPHYEFLDTFNPVQFFKSHREQTLGQAIGIVLIWGAMVATMIGAPFGIDFLLSGNPTNHLGITLVTSFIGSLSILAGIRLNQLASYNSNHTEKLILSITYLSYPINVLTHHLFNLISNLTRPLGKWRLAPLTKTGVGEDQYEWATREQGMENVRDAIRKNRPDLLERYENLNRLPPQEKEQEEESLRNEVYRITFGHFRVWGLGGAIIQKVAPYFQGSYIDALMAVFSDLDLNPLGFQLDWSREERGIESVKYVLSREVPHIMRHYKRITELSDREIHELRNEIYKITFGHFRVWGLSGAMNQKLASYFQGSYIDALMAVFSDFDLNPLGFQLDWSREERGIESVKYVLSREVPRIMRQYKRITKLSDREIHELRNEIYGITQAHFSVWGLGAAMTQESAPYFHGSYKDVLIIVFNHPRLGLTLQGFRDYRNATFERKYIWGIPESGIWSVREGIRSNRPDIITSYENLGQLKEDEIERLKRDIYGITK